LERLLILNSEEILKCASRLEKVNGCATDICAIYQSYKRLVEYTRRGHDKVIDGRVSDGSKTGALARKEGKQERSEERGGVVGPCSLRLWHYVLGMYRPD
jgi:hypothetical protein